MKYSRRAFLGGALAAGGLLAFGASAAANTSITTSSIELVEQTILISNLPPAFHGYRIGFLSDIHLGPFLPDEWVDRAVTMVKQQHVDLILLGGDHCLIPESLISRIFWVNRNPRFVKGSVPELASAIYERLVSLLLQLAPPDGMVSVYGNHDRWMAPKIAKRSLEAAGIPMLVNDTHVVRRGAETLTVFGVDDYWTGIPKLPPLPPAVPKQEIRILLSHNPDFVGRTLAHGSFSFQLACCGHTHGGQIKLPGFGAILYNVQDARFNEGLYRLNQTSVYTTRGVGVVEIPHRVNCPPEVTVLTLANE